MPKFGTKNAVFGYFWTRILKIYYCHILNQHPKICLFAKFHEKTKMPKLNALFRYFRPKMSYLGIFGLEF